MPSRIRAALPVFLSLLLAVQAWSLDLPSQPQLSCLFNDQGNPVLGLDGPYSISRESAGTSWQPDATPHQNIHWTQGQWDYMLHGFANVGYDNQSGARGAEQSFTTNMLGFMAERPFEKGALGIRTMTSLEPVMGPSGYPELLQTGETANGQVPLIDRQHPHDLFMELAVTGNHQVTENSSVFGYAGLPGDPALGPTAYMHRLSGEDIPIAPISHHWLDSTHITYGVLTGGYTWRNLKLEGSAFRGREPDQYHWNIESPKLDSYSGRLSYNPTENWSGQISYGALHSPEQLYPSTNTDRGTASVSYNRAWRDGFSGTTLAWGRDWQQNIDTLDAMLLESTFHFYRAHTLFTRFEYVQKDDLTPAVPLTSPLSGFRVVDYHPFLPPGQTGMYQLNIFGVKEWTLGYIYDFGFGNYLTWGVGGSITANFLPKALQTYYGSFPLGYTVFLRAKLGRTQAERPQDRINENPSAPLKEFEQPAQQTPPSEPLSPGTSAVPAMSEDQLAKLFDSCKPGTLLTVTLKNMKTFIAPFSSYDSVNETVWFLNPSNSLFKTRGIRLSAIIGAEPNPPSK